MHAQVEKTKGKKSRAVANSVAQKKSDGKQGFGFVDDRPKSSIQRKKRMIPDNINSKQEKPSEKHAVPKLMSVQRMSWGDIDLNKQTRVLEKVKTKLREEYTITRVDNNRMEEAIREGKDNYARDILASKNSAPRESTMEQSIFLYANLQLKAKGARLPVGNGKIVGNDVNGQRYTFYKGSNSTIEFTSVQDQKRAYEADGGTLTNGEINSSNQQPYVLSELNAFYDVNIRANGRNLATGRARHFNWSNTAAGLNQNGQGADLTWHHHLDVGRMQLINRHVHAAFNHHGGHSVWGGG